MISQLRALASTVATVFLLTLPTLSAADACSYNAPQEERASAPYERIVAATIMKATYIGPEQKRWSADAKTISATYDIPKGSNFQLQRSGHNSDCDDGERRPAVGEVWILYLNRYEAVYYPAYSIPFHKARKMDPRFGGPPRIKTRMLPPQSDK